MATSPPLPAKLRARKKASKKEKRRNKKKKKNEDMRRHTETLLLIATMSAVISCDNFEYLPYAADFYGRTGIHATSIHDIEQSCAGKDTICFAFITDTQGSYDEMRDAVDVISKRKDVMFIIHGGDQSDFGMTKEFLWTRDILDSQPLPYLCLLGNHDCLGNGEHTYTRIYGEENFSFNASFMHFVGLNTVALEYDYSHPVPDFKYIEADADTLYNMADSIRFTVVGMHAPPHDEQFNDNVDNVFEHYITRYPGLRSSDPVFSPSDNVDPVMVGTRRMGFCINGHTHRNDTKDIFGDGVLYYGLANVGKRSIQIYTITRKGYECETISF